MGRKAVKRSKQVQCTRKNPQTGNTEVYYETVEVTEYVTDTSSSYGSSDTGSSYSSE